MTEGSAFGDAMMGESEPGRAGQRLDSVLAAEIAALSRSRCRNLILEGAVRLGGATIGEPDYRVKPGEIFTVTMPELVDPAPAPEAIALNILYEDKDLIVIDKPAGLVVHPGAGNPAGTLVNALLHHCGPSLTGIGGVRRPGLVHRLDRDTSGVMVAAKTEPALHHLAAQFADHGRTGSLERAYLALVWGELRPRAGKIEAPLRRAPHNRIKQAVLAKGGRRAVTHYETLEMLAEATAPVGLLRCRLETGRTHQIRVHLAHIGHPVLGDRIYGAGFASKARLLTPPAGAALEALGRQALHAQTLAFAHPASGQVMRFEAPPPADIAALLAALRQG
jgi:23S rRNA pseudouridine1911/1915/1917 synthase